MAGMAATTNALARGCGRWRRLRPTRLLAAMAICVWAACSRAETSLRFSELGGQQFQRLGTINAFHQDSQGFIWVAGAQGLARFDGYELTWFVDAERPHSAQYVFAIEPDAQTDALWLASDAGLGYLSPARDRLRMLRPSEAGFSDVVQALAPWSDGQWLLGTDHGVLLFNPVTERFSALPNTASLNVSALATDSAGTIWIGTRGAGLYHLSSLAERPKRHTRVSGLCGDTILTLAVAPGSQSLWVGTLGDGVCHYDATERGFIAETLQETDTVWDIQFDRDGGQWLATDRGGLQWRPAGETRWRVSKPDIHDPDAISSATLRALFEDSQGDLWISQFPWGVAHHRKSNRSITRLRHHAQLTDTLTDSSILTLHHSVHDQTVWIGTERGLNRLTEQGLTRMTGPLATATVLALADAPGAGLWIGTWSQGLLRADSNGAVVGHYPGTATRADLSDRFVWALANGANGQLWAGTEIGGLNRISADGSMSHWRQADGAPALPSDFVRSLTLGYNGHVWLGTAAGAVRFNPVDGAVHPVGERHRVRDVLLRGAEVWIATQDAGIQIHAAAGEWRGAITTQQHLPSNAVAALAVDGADQVWAATSAGLARIGSAGVDRVLTRADGLAGDLYNREALLVGPDNRIYAGSSAGLSIFHPSQLPPATRPRIVFTQVQGSNGTHYPANAATIELAPDERGLQVRFAALDYGNAHAYEYGYRLTRSDQDWVNAPERMANFAHLPPGHYSLEVRVRGPGQSWQVHDTPLRFTIPTPWWRSGWAILGYLVGLIAALWVAGRWSATYYRRRFLEQAAAIDPLTGVHNRAGIERIFIRLREKPAKARPSAVIVLGIDHYKRICDRRGREVGDRVLVAIAKLLQDCMRHRDVVGRWNGDGFIVICNGSGLPGAIRLAERICAAVAAAPFENRLEPLQVTVSLGVADLPAGIDPVTAVAQAEMALHQAEHSGRNCVVAAPSHNDNSARRASVQHKPNDITASIER